MQPIPPQATVSHVKPTNTALQGFRVLAVMGLVTVTLVSVFLVVFMLIAVLSVANFSAFNTANAVGIVLYSLLVALPLIAIGVVHTVRCRRGQEKKLSIWAVWVAVGLVFGLSLWLINYESADWQYYLSPWCKSYQDMNFVDALRRIVVVSDYTPLYNYFLIIFAHLFSLQGCLYAIKYLTFVFSLALAVAMELIICHIRQTKFSYLHLALFLLLPPVLLEFTAWGQCDAIYTAFCLFAFYWALKHRSVPCFICLGLAFAIKLQFLFICPIIFVMLIIRDADGKKYLSWKWVWLAPLMYAVNLVPCLVGASFQDLLLVYFRQTGVYNKISMECANLGYLFNWVVSSQPMAAKIVVWGLALLGMAATILLLVWVLRVHRRQTLTAADIVRYALCFALVMVYCMPKMHDRFYFLAVALAWVWALVQPSRENALITTLLTLGLTLPMLQYLIGVQLGAVYLGLILNTVASALLIHREFDYLRRPR